MMGHGSLGCIPILVLCRDLAQSLEAVRRIGRICGLIQTIVLISLRMPEALMGQRRPELVAIFVLVWVAGMHELEVLGHSDPRGAFRERLFISIEALQTLGVLAIHRRVLLVSEGDARAGHAFSLRLDTLSADLWCVS